MHQEISVVHQDPLARLITLDTNRPLALILESDLDLIADRLALANIRNRADDKVISKRGYALQVQYTNVECLFCFSSPYGKPPARDFS